MEIRFFIVHYVHCLFDKNSENSHFSTFTHLAGSGRNHDISSEMSALGLFWASWKNSSLQETISWRFSYLWKKSIFSSSKFGQKNENRKFYREFVLESSDCFARGYFSIVPPNPPRKYIPTFTSHIIYVTLKILKIAPKTLIFGHSSI